MPAPTNPSLAGLRNRLNLPYHAVEESSIPFHDFNREIIQPGATEEFPNGAIGIRCDDDFWIVATLPYEYLNTPLPEIIKELFPNISWKATYKADSGSDAQTIEHLKAENQRYKRELDFLRSKNNNLQRRLRHAAEYARPAYGGSLGKPPAIRLDELKMAIVETVRHPGDSHLHRVAAEILAELFPGEKLTQENWLNTVTRASSLLLRKREFDE
jgi:hypothetical protein